MLILRKEDIKSVFSMKEAIQADKDALRIHSAGQSNSPLRVNIDIPKEQGQSLFMPAYVEEFDATGIKIVSVYPNNIEKGLPSVPAKMILLDGKTGDVISVMDGTYLTQLRTGAVQGAATDILARKDSTIGVLIGTGGQAAAQLEAMVCVRDLKEVRVADINFERAKAFAEEMQEKLGHYGAKFIAVDDTNNAIKDADIITCVTTSRRPVFDGSLVKKGAHINGVGSYTPEMQEIGEETINKADKIYFDTKEGVLSEAGDFIIPMEKGLITDENFTGEVGHVILDNIKGRENDEEITLFKSVGFAVLDVVTAHQIYKKALEMNKGQSVDI